MYNFKHLFSVILTVSGYSTVALISLTVRLKRLVNKLHGTDIKNKSDDHSKPILMRFMQSVSKVFDEL